MFADVQTSAPAVCQPPSIFLEGYISTIDMRGTGCTIGCTNFNEDCTCRNLFPTSCGSLNNNNGSIYLLMDPDSLQYAAGWLKVIGINDIQTLFGRLVVVIFRSSGAPVVWSIDIFPKLEVITPGGLEFYPQTPDLAILPGSGLSSLRVVGRQVAINPQGGSLQNTDLAFLSRLECVGDYMSLIGGLPNLTSLTGLDRIADGFSSYCAFTFSSDSPKLNNVTALAGLACCGPNQRPDDYGYNGVGQPCLTLPCGYLGSWSQLCRYIATGSCS